MTISENMKKVYSEVDEFIELLASENKEKIPVEIRNFFKKEKDINYIKNINPNVSIKKQDLKFDTLAIIALLNLNYICEDENEKENLRKIYFENEEKYNELFQVGFCSDEIFKNKELNSNENLSKDKHLIKKNKETFFSKIIKNLRKIISNLVNK